MPKNRLVIMVSRLSVVVGLFALMASDVHAQTSSVMASVTYPAAVKSRTAVLEITLEDVTAPDVPAAVVGITRMPRPDQSPVMVSVSYDPGTITPSRRYVLRGRFLDGAVTLFSSATPVRVLTGGHGSVANLTLTKIEPAPAAPPVVTTPAAAAPVQPQAAAPPTLKPASEPAPKPAPAPVSAPKTATTSAPAPKPVATPAPASAAAAPAASPKTVAAPAVPPKTVTAPAVPPKTVTAPAAVPKPVTASAAVSKPVTPSAPAPKAGATPAATTPTSKPSTPAAKPSPTPAPKPAAAPAPTSKPPAAPGPKASPVPAPKPAATPKSFSLALPPPEPIVDLPATFSGTMPCVDCPATSIELTLLPDSSYSLKRTVQGQAGRVEDESGSWSYSSDRVVLVLKSSNDRWSWFAVRGPNVLRAVDARGESIGLRAPADLQRATAPAAVSPRANPAPAEPINAPLEGVAWKLDELENKPVRPASKTHREIVLTFDPEDGGYSGVSGCNQLSGTFEASWRTLTVTPTSPMRLCRIDDGTERALIRTFKATRAYRITGQVLEWLDERGARIARFEQITR